MGHNNTCLLWTEIHIRLTSELFHFFSVAIPVFKLFPNKIEEGLGHLFKGTSTLYGVFNAEIWFISKCLIVIMFSIFYSCL